MSSCLSDQTRNALENTGNLKIISNTTSRSNSSRSLQFSDLAIPESFGNFPSPPTAFDFDHAFFPKPPLSHKSNEPFHPSCNSSNESFFAQFDAIDFKRDASEEEKFYAADQLKLSPSQLSKTKSQSSLTSTVSSNVRSLLNSIINRCTFASTSFNKNDKPAGQSKMLKKSTSLPAINLTQKTSSPATIKPVKANSWTSIQCKSADNPSLLPLQIAQTDDLWADSPGLQESKLHQNSKVDADSSIATCRSQWIAFEDSAKAEIGRLD